ncbi:MAG: cold shock domain-containing protein [Candidatus Methanomethylicaceae archaeon]
MTGFPEILTPEQAAEYLQLPVDVILSYLEQRKLPGVKLGDTWRIRRAMLDQWLDQQSLLAIEEQETYTNHSVGANRDEQVSIAQPAEVNSEEIIEKASVLPQVVQSPQASEDKESKNVTPVAQEERLSSDVQTTTVETSAKPPSKPPITQKPSAQTSKRILGKVKTFNPKTGYGFILADDGREVFVHAVDTENYGQYLKSGHRVEFEIRRVPKGWQAYNVVIVRKNAQSDSSQTPVTIPSQPAPVISKRAQVAFEQALSAREIGDFKRARELFEEAIRQGPFLNVFQAYAAMEEKENPQNAMRVLEKGIQSFPDAGILYNDYAMLKRRLGDLSGAIEVLRAGLKSAPAFAGQLHWSLAATLVERGREEDLPEAAEHAKRAKELGQYLQDDWRYIKLQILTGPKIGKQTYDFFEKAGFQVRPLSFSNQSADLLIYSDLSEYVETYDLRDRILVRCFYASINLSHLTAIQNILRTPPSRMRGLNQDVAFLAANDIQPLRDALYRLMGENREAIVPIDSQALEASHEEDSSRILRPILDQWLSRRDLYRYNYPVSGRRFFGRELDLQRLMRDIDDGHNVGVFGLRKVGKTSMLHQLRELKNQDITVYLDIQGVPSDSQDCAYLYWAIARKLREECEVKKEILGSVLEDVSFQLGSQNTPQFQKRTPRLFDHDIHAVLNRLEQNGMSTRLVLILDEVDRLLPVSDASPGFRGYADFFAYLRGTSQNSRGRFVTVITAANPALCEQAMWEGRDNPIFQFYHLMFLPPLTREDCNDMVVKLGRGMGISYSEESLDTIFHATSGHPYITRLLCSQINQLNPSRPLQVNPEMVIHARNEFLRGEATPIFSEILERLDTFFPIERDLLLFIADGVDDEIELSRLVNQPVDVALYHLIGYQLVEQTDGKYRIKIDMLHEWLRRYRLGRSR